jgi:hypothetical protein
MTLRKAISLALYLAMMAGGLWVICVWLAFGGRGIALIAGTFLAGLGVYLLWIDFLSPSRDRT